jgi:hypothetical protein
MNDSTRSRLTKGVTKLEQLHARQREHDRMIRKLADSMADTATETMAREEKAALAGDEGAISRHFKAAHGRYEARRISGDE